MEKIFEIISNYYGFIKATHIVAVICWIASILYLLRIFVYHSQVLKDSETDKIFQTMERKVVKIIMNPAIIITYLTGVTNALIYGLEALGLWFYIKIFSVLVITIFHFLSIRWKNQFALGENKKTALFFRLTNEIPTLMMIIAVFMVVIKPFE